MTENDVVHGFKLLVIKDLPDINAVGYLLRHEKSGAMFLHLHTNDPENAMAIGVKTIPQDNTGLTHILEHTVLAGSENFPIKDPFFWMFKNSLQTFMNAFTYPDKTIYPFSSLNRKDFWNIFSVYLDAVFHARIDREKFLQEGWRFDFEKHGDIASDLIRKGVVLNEMKGAYSSPDSLISDIVTKTLFPDTPYGLDSGGDPGVIPKLTFRALKGYYKKLYHPSNCWFVSTGDISTEDHCKFLNPILSKFNRKKLNPKLTTVAEQPRWNTPVYKNEKYPNDQVDDSSFVVVGFLIGSVLDIEETLAFKILTQYLIGTDASPLRKALIESGLGSDMTASGFETDIRDTVFSAGLKGTEFYHRNEIVKLIFDTCREIVGRGIDKEEIESVFHQFEISQRETDGGSFPYPIRLILRAFKTCFYGASPFKNFDTGRGLENLRRRFKTESDFFEELLRKKILENPHHAVISLFPDRRVAEEKKWRSKKELERIKSTMSLGQLRKIGRESRKLNEIQSIPEDPKEIARMPQLKLEDIPRESPSLFEIKDEPFSGVHFFSNDTFSKGLNYLNLGFGLKFIRHGIISPDLLCYLPIFADALVGMGADGKNYDKMIQLEMAYTGGIDAHISIPGSVTESPFRVSDPFFLIQAVSLDRHIEKMLWILKMRLLRADFSDDKRLKNILEENHVAIRRAIIENGTAYAKIRAQSVFSVNGWIKEQTRGISQFVFLGNLLKNFDFRLPVLRENLYFLRDLLLDPKNLETISFVGSQRNLVRDYMKDMFLGKRDSHSPNRMKKSPDFGTTLIREGFATESDTASNVLVFKTVGAGTSFAPAILFISEFLSKYLHEEIREKGGAYGSGVVYDWGEGIFRLTSFRDPNIEKTYEVFRQIMGKNIGKHLTQDEMRRVVIGSMGNFDFALRPRMISSLILGRHYSGGDNEFLRAFRARVINLNKIDIENAMSRLVQDMEKGCSLCSISSRRKLEKANKKMKDKLKIIDL